MFNRTLFNFLVTVFIGLSQQAPVDDVHDNGKVLPMTMTYFNNSLGTYIEHRGRASVIMSEWTIVVYYDMQPLLAQIKTFLDHYETLMDYCGATPGHFCPITLQSDRNEIQGASLYRGLSTKLDSVYVKHIGATISRIQANEVNFRDMLTNRTSVIDSTVNVMRETQASTNERLSLIGARIEQLKYFETNSSIIIFLTEELTALAGRIRRTQDAILDAVIPAQQGKLNPMILSVKQMENELNLILAHLPQDRRLPFNVLTLADVYRVATISHIQQLERHLLFHIKLPLVDVEQFDVYHLTPIPRVAVEASGLHLLYTETPNLAISDHLDRYFPLRDAELDSCLQLQQERFLCQPQQITFGRDSGMLPCTLAAFRNHTQSPACRPRHVNQSSLWIPLAAPNRWMVAVTKELSIMGVCSDDRQQLHINGSGILTIRSDCIVRSTSVTLQGMPGATAGKSYASLTSLDVEPQSALTPQPLELGQGSAVAIIVACTLVLIIASISLGWFYYYQRRGRAQQTQSPVEDHQTKSNGSCNDHPLLEKPLGE
ncbi:uncharacterized protein LOC111077069 [Drosophila obscura]|uniref:uncharacterized protein LOC111077069 n=1 Tax=Drosophila obscura TaxID=7282 RepID=UPI001BB15F76|nr:uncharacterized protein LOC111077069 [Drosophila obscura]